MSRCPTCGRGPRRPVNPFDAVVVGTATEADAPLLVPAWRALSALLALVDEPVRRDVLIRCARDGLTEAADETCAHLIRAAVKAGLIRQTYATTGTPARRRAYVVLVNNDTQVTP